MARSSGGRKLAVLVLGLAVSGGPFLSPASAKRVVRRLIADLSVLQARAGEKAQAKDAEGDNRSAAEPGIGEASPHVAGVAFEENVTSGRPLEVAQIEVRGKSTSASPSDVHQKVDRLEQHMIRLLDRRVNSLFGVGPGGYNVSRATPAALHHQEVPVPDILYPVTCLGCACLVMVLYGPLGVSVAVAVLAYVAALSTITLSVKFVLSANHFPYPKLLTATQFCTAATVSGGVLAHRKLSQNIEIQPPTTQEFVFGMIPIAMAVVISVGANNTALVYSSASFLEILSSANSCVTMIVVAVLGMPLDQSLILPALLVVSGCMLASFGDVEFSLMGAVLCLLGCLFRSIKAALQQKLLTGKSKHKFDPISLLFWVAIPSAISMFAFSLATEGIAPYKDLMERDDASLMKLHFAVGLSCANAVLQNVSQLIVTKDLGAVGSQLAAQMKMVLVVLGGVALFDEKVTALEGVGFGLAICGVYWFSRADAEVRKRNEHEKDVGVPKVQGDVIEKVPK